MKRDTKTVLRNLNEGYSVTITWPVPCKDWYYNDVIETISKIGRNQYKLEAINVAAEIVWKIVTRKQLIEKLERINFKLFYLEKGNKAFNPY